MTKDKFYQNCLTEKGREENKNLLAPITMDGIYYKNTEIDINDMRTWNEIIYLSKYGKEMTWEALIDGEVIQEDIKDENDRTIHYKGEIVPNETFGQILGQDKWEIYTMWDIIQKTIIVYENVPPIREKKSLQEYADVAKKVYEMAKGESIVYYLGELTNKIL